jgi:hypothetical protein
MDMLKKIFHGFILLALLAGLLSVMPVAAQSAPASGKGLSPESMLNPDGTLKLNGQTNGSLDLSGWNVAIDPQRGPVLSREEKTSQMQQNLPSVGNWENLGGGVPPFNGMVYAIAVSGSFVYVGGDFKDLNGGIAVDYIARWDGVSWSSMGTNANFNGSLNSSVYAITVDGSDIYVGGNFTDVNNFGTVLDNADYIARFNTADGNWYALGQDGSGSGALDSYVMAIAVDNNYVYAGGHFTNVDNNGTVLNAADYIAAYSKSTTDWSALGSNGGSGALNNDVYTLAVNDTGLYAGGAFTDAAAIPHASYIARWNGSAWNALGDCTGVSCLNADVMTIALRGSGVLTQVWAGGQFSSVRDSTGATIPNLQYVAYFDGADWGSIASGNPINGAVNSIVFSGVNTVYLAGGFTDAGGVNTADYVAKLTGATWSGLGGGGLVLNGPISAPVHVIALSGSNLYAGGAFAVQGPVSLIPTANNFAYWDGTAWSGTGALNGALNYAPDGSTGVYAIVTMGTDVFVGGSFKDAAGIAEADNIAKWDGGSWSALGSNGSGNGAISGGVYALSVIGSDLYVGGTFNNAAVIAGADNLAKWDTHTQTWSALGGGVSGQVFSLTTDGTSLYAGGGMVNMNGIPEADWVVQWNPQSATWSALGSNGNGNGALNNFVNGLAYQGGNLYVAGSFTDAAGLSAADYIAKWDGSNWSALGSDGNGNGAINSYVFEVAASGPYVYVQGEFTDAAGIAQADYLAMWNGTSWSALNGATFTPDTIAALVAVGPVLYVGASAQNIGGIPEADYIAKWDGSSWSAIGSNGAGDGSLNNNPETLYASTSDNAVYAGGWFTDVNNNGTVLTEADYIAAFGADLTPPTVTSIVRAETTPTTAATVHYTVTFSEAVTGVDAGDFSLNTSGVSGATVSGVSGSGASYTVTVNSGSGDGTIRLDLTDNDTIQDAASNPLGGSGMGNGSFTNGEVYQVAKIVPLLVTPANGEVLHTLRPFLDWSDIPGVAGYQVQISKSAAFSTTVINATVTGAANSRYTATKDLTAKTLYYWRVRTKISSLKYGAWSAGQTFTTGNPPSIPTLVSPASGALLTNQTPNLDWSDSTVPAGTTLSHYQFQLDDNSDFSSPLEDVDVNTSDHVANKLATNGKYYWRVRSWNTNSDPSGWSSTRNFRVAIDSPILVSPVLGVTVPGLKPSFDWSDVVGASGYTIQVSLSNTFGSMAINATLKTPTSNYTAGINLLSGKTYYWRVRSNSLNGPSLWSTVETFMTP